MDALRACDNIYTCEELFLDYIAFISFLKKHHLCKSDNNSFEYRQHKSQKHSYAKTNQTKFYNHGKPCLLKFGSDTDNICVKSTLVLEYNCFEYYAFH